MNQTQNRVLCYKTCSRGLKIGSEWTSVIIEAEVKVVIDGLIKLIVAEGDSHLDALVKAMQKAFCLPQEGLAISITNVADSEFGSFLDGLCSSMSEMNEMVSVAS